MKRYIYDKLMSYQKQGELPFHMPGHKRRIRNGITNPYAIDITEIDGFDDLHDPQEMILDSMEEIGQIYGTKRSYYLVNGSTSGLLTAISACCRCNDRIVMARNCHKAVYHAIQLLQLKPVYIPILYHGGDGIAGGVDEQALYELLHSENQIKAVVVTSPTYEGVISDIGKISQWTRELGIPLVVDEAHGAHLRYHKDFPQSAVDLGADLVIQSLHKTLPSLTQTAMLHLCSDLVEEERIKSYLSIYQSSSPSYIFMASMEYAIAYAVEQGDRWDRYVELLQEYRSKMQQFHCLKLAGMEEMRDYGAYAYDPCKFVIVIERSSMCLNRNKCYLHDGSGENYRHYMKQTKITGLELKDCLKEEFQIQLEMAERNYVIAMTSIMDGREEMERLYQALKKIDKRLSNGTYIKNNRCLIENDPYLTENNTCSTKKNTYFVENETYLLNLEAIQNNECILIPGKAADADGILVPLSDSIEQISRDYVYIYPPGIPILVPGERIQAQCIQVIEQYLRMGFSVKGIARGKIRICIQKTIYQQKDMI